MEKFKSKFGKDYGFFQDKYLDPERTKRKEYAEGIDQIISSKAHQEEQETKSRWMETKSKHKHKEDEIERNMQIYGDNSIYLGHFLFSLPQTRLIMQVTHATLSVQT